MAAHTWPQPRRHSIPSGDLVLCSPPPYSTQPWLAMGVVVHAALLAQAGMRVRVIRPLDPPFIVPPGVLHASMLTFTRNPPIEARMAAMENEYLTDATFFDGLVDEVLAGSESLVCLSLWRNNVDTGLYLAKLVKARRPSTFVLLGGPEAIDEPESLRLPWVDAVVGVDAEGVLLTLVEAVLAGGPERAAGLPHVWLNPRFGVGGLAHSTAAVTSTPLLPPIDYTALLPLLVGDAEATMPLLLNWGCPYHCGFCANRNVYSRFTAGSPTAVVDQLDAIMTGWVELHGGHAPGITLQLSDATTNAIPTQFDAVLEGVVARQRNWGSHPLIRGQTLFDTRITKERVRLMAEGGFRSTFFGLESGSDRLRRALRKPGTIAQVAAAMLTYHRGGAGGLHFGVPVGIPGETDDDFLATERFVEWALGLKGTIASITVLPYAFFLTAQDASLCRRNHGERRGVLWRMDAPGGDPAVRARRLMRLFDRIDGRVPVNCPFPPYLFLPEMLPDEDPARLEAWMARHGRSFDQLTPKESPAPSTLESAFAELGLADPAFAAACERARDALTTSLPDGAWRIERFDCSIAKQSALGMAVFFRRETEPSCLIVLLEPRDNGAASYAQSRDFNISYWKEWRGRACGFDDGLLTWCVETLRHAEVTAPQ